MSVNNFLIQGGLQFPDGSIQQAASPVVLDTKIIVVKKGATASGQFSSIKDAVDSISGSNPGNPFVITVGPGLYTEDTITMKSGISIIAETLGSVLILPLVNTQTMFIGYDGASLVNLIINGANGVGGLGVYFSSTTPGTGFLIKDCNFNNNETQVHCYGATYQSIVYIDRCSVTGNITNGFIVGNTSSISSQVVLTNCTYRDLTAPVVTTFASVSGTNTLLTITNTTLRIVPGISGTTCLWAEDGGELRAMSTSIRGFDHAIQAANVGSAPNLILDSLTITDSLNYDVLIEHPGTTGHFFGTVTHTKTSIDPSAPFYIYNDDPHVLKVAKNGSDFTSIYDAIASINFSDFNERYTIIVNPGHYVEPTLDLTSKPYVSVVGTSIEGVVIEPADSVSPIFLLGVQNEISFMSLQNTGAGQEGIRVYDSGNYSQAHKVSFLNCDICVGVYSNSQDTYFYGEYLDFNGIYSIGTKVVSENGFVAFANLENYYNLPLGGTNTIGTYISGSGSTCEILASGNLGEGNGIGVYCDDGSRVNISGTYFRNFDIGIQMGATGAPARLEIAATDAQDNPTWNLDIQHPDGKGFYVGWIPHQTQNIPDSAPFFITNKDPKIVSVFKKDGDFQSVKDAIDHLISQVSTTNRFIVQVGPGTYVEDTITLVPYVTIVGAGADDTIIQASNPDNHIIIGADNSGISNLLLTGATSSGSCAIYWGSSTAISTTAMNVENVRFGNNDTHVINQPIGVKSIMVMNNIHFGGEYQYNKGFLAISATGGTGRILIRDSTTIGGHTTPYPEYVFSAQGTGAEMILNGVNSNSGKTTPTTTSCVMVKDGGLVRMSSVQLKGWGSAVQSLNIGTAPTVISSGIVFDNNTLNLDIQHIGTLGRYTGESTYLNTYIYPSAPFYITGQQVNIVTVSRKGGDFTSINAAINFIITNLTYPSVSNRYLVSVGPGIFQETPINMVPFISIVGSGRTTGIQCVTSSQHVIIGSDFSSIEDCIITGAGVGYAGIYHESPTGASNTAFVVKNVIFGDNDTHVICYADTNPTTVQVIDCRYGGSYTFDKGFYASNNNNTVAARILLLHSYSQGMPSTKPTYFAKISGTNCEIVMNSVQANSSATIPQIGSYFLWIENGAKCKLNAVNFTGWDYGIYNPNDAGAACTLLAVATTCQTTNHHVIIENPNTIGSLFGCFETNKVSNVASSLSVVFLDTSGGFTIDNKLNMTFTPTLSTDVSTLWLQASSMGVMKGGLLSTVSGLTLSITPGYGYYHLNDNVLGPGYLHIVDWEQTELTVPTYSTVYVYFNSSSILVTDPSFPVTSENILLGRVRTTATEIEFIEKTPFFAEHWSNRTAELFRKGFGPIYSEGSTVTENTTPYKLNVSQGTYYVGSNEFNPSGGTGITFSSYYYNGSSWIISVTSSVDHTHYAGTSSLIGLSSSYYVKHSLYIVGAADTEKYFLVYGQNQYDLLLDAQNANIPTPPNYFTEGVALIAGIIVQQGTASIVEIRDQRPVIGFKASGINAAANHGSLLGLLDDDHPQYLLTNGGRVMTGNLVMGSNSISGVNTYNGVTIESHESRHLPNGSDPILTGTPSSIGTTNQIGFANALSRQDHIHAHGNLAGGLLHATASSISPGFMSAADKAKLDLMSPFRDASTGVISGGILSFGTSSNYFAISDGSGQVAVNTGNSQSISNVIWSGLTNISLPYLPTELVTFIGIDSTGSVVQQTTPFTRDQTRSIIALGAAVHLDHINLIGFDNLQNVVISPSNQLIDLSESISFFNISGNVFTYNGANLNINNSSGYAYKAGSNWATDQLNPNILQLSGLTAASFYYRLQNGDNAESNVTNINPNIYDVSGSTSSVPTGKYTVQRMYLFTNNDCTIQLGQFVYNSIADAKTSISSEKYVTDYNLGSNGLLRGFLIVKQGTTDLSNTNNAVFLEATKISTAIGIGIPNVTDIQSTISTTGPLNYTSGVISMSQSSATQSGYLTFTDWNTFNNKGQTGPQGPIGTGVQGPQGNQGTIGDTGNQGAQGNQGIQGPQGNQGNQGNIGATGNQGAQGNQGNIGATGNQGTQGLTGSQGAQGNQGNQGVQGIQGVSDRYQATSSTTFKIPSVGATVSLTIPISLAYSANQTALVTANLNVDDYFQGTVQSYDSASGFIQLLAISSTHSGTTHSSWTINLAGAVGSVGAAGAQGAQGNQGNIGATGNQGPQGNQGVQGNQGNIGATGNQGPQGNQGVQGNQGSIGATGNQGAQGNQGNIGATGNQGAQGNQGNIGTTGSQGPQGNQGVQGNQGNIGATGSQGPQGNQGSIGATGSQGPQGNQGSIGATGSQGPQGNQGSIGATGSQGAKGNTGSIFGTWSGPSPADPTATTNTTGVMMGLSGSITPIRSGTILIIISGSGDNATNSRGGTIGLRYGTGTPPVNGAALTGTLVQTSNFQNSNAAQLFPFSVNDIITGLTLNTAVWFDLSLAASGGAGTARVRGINISIIEI